jgi:hypothetical protein
MMILVINLGLMCLSSTKIQQKSCPDMEAANELILMLFSS